MSHPSHTAAAKLNALARKNYAKRKPVQTKPVLISVAEAKSN